MRYIDAIMRLNCFVTMHMGYIVFVSGYKFQVLFDGIPIKNLNLGWLRKTIGVVSQEPVLFAATIEENLRLGEFYLILPITLKSISVMI